jgi:hypothetical protein
MATYRGVSKLEDGFLEGHVRDAPIPGMTARRRAKAILLVGPGGN